jgi:hypothetical protein
MIDSDIYTNPTLNIAIIGCISSGKSTLMNSLFSETYSDMKIKKTTMCPQVYKTDNSLLKNKDYAKEIRTQNTKINKKLYDNGNINDCKEIIYNVLPIPNIFDDTKYGKDIEYKIYDIPGLNDSETKNKFYDYIKNNFYKFDIIIYNVDINSGLNTTDELDILKLVKECISNILTIYNKEIKLIIICNKCDDLIENDKGELIGTDETEEMYKQVCKIVKSNDIKCPIVKYSAAYTYMYRSINTPENIDIEYINKIGIDNFGRVPWSKQSKNKTTEQLWNLIKPHLNDSASQSLKLSGFENLKKVLNEQIIKNELHIILYSKINFCLDISDFMSKYNFMQNLNKIFKNTQYNNDVLTKYFSTYLEYLTNKYNFTSITALNIVIAEEYYKILNELLVLEFEKNDTEKIKILIDKYNNMKALYQLDFIKKTNEFKNGDIFPILHNVIEKSTDGKNLLLQTKIIDDLLKVPIDDFYNMVSYLYDNDIEHSQLMNIYSKKIIDMITKNSYCPMYKNYLLYYYFDTSDEFYNYLVCSIPNTTIHTNFNKEDYDKLLLKINDFIKFYNRKNKTDEELISKVNKFILDKSKKSIEIIIDSENEEDNEKNFDIENNFCDEITNTEQYNESDFYDEEDYYSNNEPLLFDEIIDCESESEQYNESDFYDEEGDYSNAEPLLFDEIIDYENKEDNISVKMIKRDEKTKTQMINKTVSFNNNTKEFDIFRSLGNSLLINNLLEK